MDPPSSPAGANLDAPSFAASRPPAPSHKRSSSGAGGLLLKLPFLRSTGEHRPRSRRNTNETEPATSMSVLPTPSFTTIPADTPSRHRSTAATPPPPPHTIQHKILQSPRQHKTRRRRGSLRKVALLGRGAQRERREGRALTLDTDLDPRKITGPPAEAPSEPMETAAPETGPADGRPDTTATPKSDERELLSLGLGISDMTPRASIGGYAIRSGTPSSDPDATPTAAQAPTSMNGATALPRKHVSSPSRSVSYSTTDDEDALHMGRSTPSIIPISRPTTPSLSLSSSSTSLLRPERASLSSGSDSYYLTLPHPRPRPPAISAGIGGGALPPIRRRSPAQRAKSPLALTSLTAPLSPPDADWDYAETEWWGWIILLVTWTVFVVGMGSCLGVWSWAWDVGTTPYAPPELEDDPTLPIVGYYPALMILTGVMAWVWVVVAWVGMKYFRHAQVSGD